VATFRAAWAAGREITLEQVYEYALSQGLREPQRPDAAPPALTGRETEIAALVARGLTNRRIAEELSISARTVDTHVGRILKKLGLHSREQVADPFGEQRRNDGS
jgi:non-specific serine/threonine protein kinase